MNFANTYIQNMQAYSPPLKSRRTYEGLLLNFNERTVPVSPKVKDAILDFVKEDKLQVYPEYNNLCYQIANYAEVDEGQIMITNGSDQGIDLVFRTFTKQGDKVIIPSPSFAMFYQSGGLCGNKILRPSYKKDLSFPLDKVLELIDDEIKLVVICNPNNPTGTLLPLKGIEKIAKKAPKAIVMVDEAYFEFSGITAAVLIDKYPNIVVTRTFSKAFGLAAFRMGYLISRKENLEEMLKVRGPYDVNMPACFAVKAALRDRQYMESFAIEVMEEAKPMVEKFFTENRIEYFPSKANFLLFRTTNTGEIFQILKKNGMLLRPSKGQNIENTIRLTIGTVEQMQQFIEAYKGLFLNSKS